MSPHLPLQWQAGPATVASAWLRPPSLPDDRSRPYLSPAEVRFLDLTVATRSWSMSDGCGSQCRSKPLPRTLLSRFLRDGLLTRSLSRVDESSTGSRIV